MSRLVLALQQAFDVIGPALEAGLTACLLTLVATPIVRAAAVRFGWVGRPAAGSTTGDTPSPAGTGPARPAETRWGRRVIARLGGAAMFIGLAATMLLWGPNTPAGFGLLAGAALSFILGLIDDLKRLPPYTKLIGQLLIGCLVVFSGIRIDLIHLPWLAIPLSILWIVLVMNAFNLLDNMDGLAAGVGAIAAGFCAIHAGLAGERDMVLVNAAVCGACLGFLRFNFPPAKIYMGDSGSHLLGVTLATTSLLGSWRNSTHLLSILAIPSLVLAVPIFDTCFVTIQRLVHRRHPFVGGTDHVSHRLAILGLSTRQTVVVLYTLSVALGLFSLAAVMMHPLSNLAIGLFLVTLFVLMGRYLARVRVYRLKEESGMAPAVEVEVSSPVTLIDTMLLHKRRLVEVLVDFCLISGVYVFAHLLRFEGVLGGYEQELIRRSLPLILLLKITCFAGCGVYRRVWTHPDLSDILTVFKAVTLGSIVSAVALVYGWRFEGHSRAVLIIDWMLSFLAVGGSRVMERLFDEWIGAAVAQKKPVLILGAGETGERVLHWIKSDRKSARRIVGFLDDDPRKVGNHLHGVAVLGACDRLPHLLDAKRIEEVLIAITDPPGALLQRVQRHCEPRGIRWKVVSSGVTDTV